MLREATHEIHVLHRLARCTLDHIVYGGNNDNPTGARIKLTADIAVIAAPKILSRRILPNLANPNKLLLAIKILIKFGQSRNPRSIRPRAGCRKDTSSPQAA